MIFAVNFAHKFFRIFFAFSLSFFCRRRFLGRFRQLRSFFLSARRKTEFTDSSPILKMNFLRVLRKKAVQSVHKKFNLLELNRVEHFQPSHVIFREAESYDRLEFAGGINVIFKQHFKFCEVIRPILWKQRQGKKPHDMNFVAVFQFQRSASGRQCAVRGKFNIFVTCRDSRLRYEYHEILDRNDKQF